MVNFAQYNKKCLRCENVDLKLLPESNEEITFYECPKCLCHYAQKPNHGICDRWGSPISAVLYCIIFERRPQDAYQRVAQYFLDLKTYNIPLMIKEIDRELQKPTQNLRDIHNLVFMPNEEDVRDFLRLVADYWKEKLKGNI